MHNAWKSAEPGVLFWDTIIRESVPDCYADLGYKTVSTNPCGEIPLCPYDSCRLLAINLYSYVVNPFKPDAYFDFDLSDGTPLEVKVALSPVSASGALNNLRIETAGKNFGQLCAQAGQKWEDALSVIDVKGDYDQVCNIYSSMYHTMINPSVYMDHDGSYRGLDQELSLIHI